MFEVKIQCDCGQKIKFDVEPVNGQMPFALNCPICGADGTAKANHAIREIVGAAAARPVYSAAAAPVAVASAPPTVRLSHAAMPVAGPPALALAPSATVATPAAVALPAPPSALGRPQPLPAGAAPALPAAKPSFGLGLLGALCGTLVGALVYFLIFNYTGFRVKLLAIGVGYLSGLGAELLGRKEGSKELGLLAAAFALAGIVGAQYFVLHNWWQAEGVPSGPTTYEMAVAESKTVLAAMPNGTDEEIRNYLAKEYAEEDEKPDPSGVTAEDIKEFRDSEFAQYKALAEGKITKEVYDKEHEEEAKQAAKDKEDDEGTFKAFFLVFMISKMNILSLIGAAGLAYKACANA